MKDYDIVMNVLTETAATSRSAVEMEFVQEGIDALERMGKAEDDNG